MGKKAHDMSLGRGQLHLGKGMGHGLIRTSVEDPDQMAVVLLQRITSG